MSNEVLFDKDSFRDEITNASEAQSCLEYLTSNERGFRLGLMNAGKSHEQEEEAVRRVWVNLIKSCRRVGLRDEWLDEKARKYGL